METISTSILGRQQQQRTTTAAAQQQQQQQLVAAAGRPQTRRMELSVMRLYQLVRSGHSSEMRMKNEFEG